MKRSGKQVHKRYNYLSNLRIDRQLISHHICYMADEEMGDAYFTVSSTNHVGLRC